MNVDERIAQLEALADASHPAAKAALEDGIRLLKYRRSHPLQTSRAYQRVERAEEVRHTELALRDRADTVRRDIAREAKERAISRRLAESVCTHGAGRSRCPVPGCPHSGANDEQDASSWRDRTAPHE